MRKKALYLLLIIISLFALGVSLNSKVQVERLAKSVEVNIDYYEADLLAKQSDMELVEWLREFKSMGIYGVAIEEESLKTMKQDMKKLQYHLSSEILNDIYRTENYSKELNNMIDKGKIDKYDIIIESNDEDIEAFLLNGLKSRYTSEFYTYVAGDTSYIVLDGTLKDAYFSEVQIGTDYTEKRVALPEIIVASKLEDIGFGFDSKKIEIIQDAGLNPLLRPRNYERYATKLIEAYDKDVKKYDADITSIIAIGSSILGNDGSVSQTEKIYEYLSDEDIPVGLIETTVQRGNIEQNGIEQMVTYLDYSAVRTFSLIEYLQLRYKYYNYSGAEEIENTIYRAVTERNIRNIYFRPFLKSKKIYVTDVEEYRNTFKRLEVRLADHNFKFGRASVMNYNKISIFNVGMMALGLLAFGVLLLKLIFRIGERLELLILGLGTVGILPALFIAPNLVSKILALLSSIIMPSLAIVLLLEYSRTRLEDSKVYRLKEIMLNATAVLLLGVLISVLGGLYISAILSGSEYMLEMSIFRGVKISQLLPMGVFVVAYVVNFGYKRDANEEVTRFSYFNDLKRLINENIKVIYVLIGTVILAIGYVYIARTGHETNIQPSNLEMIFRNFLEVKLLARPRNKEFLIAFPGLVLMVYLICKKYKSAVFPLALISLIGFTSVVNTFSHLRTPLYLSALRTVFSGLFGLIIGLVGTLLIHFILYMINNLRRRIRHE
ncbi:MAG: DUF5693 family protein [Acidaminobacteraceae bacterium]